MRNLNLIRLNKNHEIKPFDCNDADLNNFLLNDAKPALVQNLAVTYLLQEEDRTSAYFSLLNDKISLKELRAEAFNHIRSRFLNTGFDDLASYPAVKVGRLGVDVCSQGNGVGRWILNYLKVLFLNNNRAGCRFITVDAYRESLEFYRKIGFELMTVKDKEKPARLMYFDLQKGLGGIRASA
ncbi:MAG TPA: GNAT family N-acetyltransferase [Pedobacter sp.]